MIAPAVILLASAISVNLRIAEQENRLPSMTPMAFENPATRQWMLPVSYSHITAGFDHESANRAVDPRAGKGHDIFRAGASGYIKHRSSTLWGSADYSNGTVRDIHWNESSDIETVGPYLLADSIGGNMRCESYGFAGGYADHSGRWAWGASIGYHAGLHYRNVDPRPRNTTNRLDLSAGASLRIGSGEYRAGLAMLYRKYKQTSELEFVNEMSDNRIWHLTGLGTHYERFESLGYDHYYDGNRLGISADLFPGNRRGLSVAASFYRTIIDHILTSLNKLPLQTLADNDFSAQAAWLAPGNSHDWSANATFRYSTRTGTENIFGDPAAGIYPQIGGLDMYRRERITIAAEGLWQWRPHEGTVFAVQPSVGFNSDHQTYADPCRYVNLDRLIPSLRLFFARGVGRLWRFSTETIAGVSIPLSSSVFLPWDTSVPEGLQTLERDRADILSKSHSSFALALGASRAINRNYALRLSLNGNYRAYAMSVRSYGISAAVSFIF